MGASHAAGAGAGALAIPLLAAPRHRQLCLWKHRLLGCAQLPRGGCCSSTPGKALWPHPLENRGLSQRSPSFIKLGPGRKGLGIVSPCGAPKGDRYKVRRNTRCSCPLVEVEDAGAWVRSSSRVGGCKGRGVAAHTGVHRQSWRGQGWEARTGLRVAPLLEGSSGWEGRAGSPPQSTAGSSAGSSQREGAGRAAREHLSGSKGPWARVVCALQTLPWLTEMQMGHN